MNLYRYKATIYNVVDGDTIDAIVDLGFGKTWKTRFRIYNEEGFYFDTPELRGRDVNEAHKAHGIAAKLRAEELLLNQEVIIRTHKKGTFRYLAEIFLPALEGKNYTEIMKEEGFQKKDVY